MKRFIALFFVLGLLVAAIPLVGAAQAWPADSGVEIGAAVRELYPAIEPSGLAWHSGRNQLLLVGDEGQLVAMNSDGSSPTLWSVSGDLEDVTVADPSSSYVYLADENGKILKFNLSTGTVSQSWSVATWMPEVDCDGVASTTSTCGMEGLTYANGYFYAGYQYNGKIFKLDLSGTTAVKMAEFTGLSKGISGLHYKDGYLYALYNSTLAVLSMSGEVLASYAVPGSSQEGLALGVDSNGDGDANMFIAEDGTGKVYSYDNFPIFAWGVEIKRDGVDNNNNGLIDETNVGFAHPYYSTLNANESYTGKIVNFAGLGWGDIYVLYADGSAFRFSAFDVNTKQKSTVTSIDGTAVFQVTSKGVSVKINAYTGQLVP